jgi:hypothetical protein
MYRTCPNEEGQYGMAPTFAPSFANSLVTDLSSIIPNQDVRLCYITPFGLCEILIES